MTLEILNMTGPISHPSQGTRVAAVCPQAVPRLIYPYHGWSLSSVSLHTASSITAEDAPVNLWLSTSLAYVIIIIGIFSYYMESKSSRIMKWFKNMVPQDATVICGSQLHYVEDVVVGDAVKIRIAAHIQGDT
jgi:magnesium-transporting ATPase (P-type)